MARSYKVSSSINYGKWRAWRHLQRPAESGFVCSLFYMNPNRSSRPQGSTADSYHTHRPNTSPWVHNRSSLFRGCHLPPWCSRLGMWQSKGRHDVVDDTRVNAPRPRCRRLYDTTHFHHLEHRRGRCWCDAWSNLVGRTAAYLGRRPFPDMCGD